GASSCRDQPGARLLHGPNKICQLAEAWALLPALIPCRLETTFPQVYAEIVCALTLQASLSSFVLALPSAFSWRWLPRRQQRKVRNHRPGSGSERGRKQTAPTTNLTWSVIGKESRSLWQKIQLPKMKWSSGTSPRPGGPAN